MSVFTAILFVASVGLRSASPSGSDFILHGTVEATLNRHAFILNTGTNSLHVHCPDLTCPTTGDVLTVSGSVITGKFREKKHLARKILKDGKSAVSPILSQPLARLQDATFACRRIRTQGTVLDSFVDEVDPRYHHFVLKDHRNLLHVAIPEHALTDEPQERFIGSVMEVTGVCLRNRGGSRIIIGNMLVVDDDSRVRIIRPAPEDPFDVPVLEDLHHVDPALVANMDVRRVEGHVIAVWNGNRFMVETADGRTVQATVIGERNPPRYGASVVVAGHPDTDLFHVNLINADFKVTGTGSPSRQEPADVTAEKIFLSPDGEHKLDITYHGLAIRLTGIVRGLPPENGRFSLECGRFLLPVDVSGNPALADGLATGDTVSIAGICIFETESWNQNLILPRIKGFLLVPRTPEDILLLHRPSWWTPKRLTMLIAALFAALLSILVWNRILNRIVNRRSRELLKEQISHTASELRIGERTRLAVELHDSLSQNLAGIACQIAATRNAIGTQDDLARSRLATVERMLKSCRTELRHCLSDLRSDMLEEQDFTVAIRKSLEQLDENADIAIRFDIPRAKLLDSTAHAILCIVRELVSNAIRHGNATKLSVTGLTEDGFLTIAVQDNGCGFDPEACQGPAEGHFGLDGIRDRLKKFDGTLKIVSAAGTTVATAIIPLSTSPIADS